jgi:hypothetical protein
VLRPRSSNPDLRRTAAHAFAPHGFENAGTWRALASAQIAQAQDHPIKHFRSWEGDRIDLKSQPYEGSESTNRYFITVPNRLVLL